MTQQRHFFRFTALLSAIAFLSACGGSNNGGYYVEETGAPPYTDPMAAPYGQQPYAQQQPSTTQPPSEPVPPAPAGSKPWSPPSQTTPPTSSAAASKYPKGQPIPGKPGLVKSPHAPYAGEVDVSGLKSGQAAKCPYTGKIFIVP